MVNAQTPGNNTLRNDVTNQLNSGNDIIDRDFQNYMSQLAGQENDLRAQSPLAEQKVNNAYTSATNSLNQQVQGKQQTLDTQQQQTATQEKSALQQARDLYRQTQQQNVAQLSGMGLSSSSVAEALAENQGVETARRIASVSSSAQDVYQNIQKERANLQDYVTTRTQELEQEKASQMAQIQQQLMQGLNQINSARNSAAVDKANKRQELLQQTQSAVAQLQAKAEEFQQSMQQWAAQNNAKLQAAASTDYSQHFNSFLQQLPGLTQMLPQGYGAEASLNMPGGGKFTVKPQNQKKDETTQLLESLGIFDQSQ
jgi:hypothetical protein